MPTYRRNEADSANPREAERITGFSHGIDPTGQDRLRGMVLVVTPPMADGGQVPHTAARNKHDVARCLQHPTAVSSTSHLSPRSGRRERYHHLRCSMPLARTGEALVRVPPHTYCRCTAAWTPLVPLASHSH